MPLDYPSLPNCTSTIVNNINVFITVIIPLPLLHRLILFFSAEMAATLVCFETRSHAGAVFTPLLHGSSGDCPDCHHPHNHLHCILSSSLLSSLSFFQLLYNHYTMRLSPLKNCIKEFWLNAFLVPHFPSV